MGVAICHRIFQSEKAESSPRALTRLCYNNKHSGDFVICDVARDHPRHRSLLREDEAAGRLVSAHSRGLPQGMAMLEAPVLLNSVSTGSKPYAPGRNTKRCSSVRGAGHRDASKVAHGRDYQDSVAWCGNGRCQAASPPPS